MKSTATGPSDRADATPIGDASPDFGSNAGEAASLKPLENVGPIFARAAGSRALNLAAMLQQGLSPAETIAAQLTGAPQEVTQVGQMRALASGIAPKVDPNNPLERLADMAGGFVPDIVAAAATGGMSEIPEGAGLLARGLHGALSMLLPGAENTREAYNKGVADGLTPLQAAEQGAVSGVGTLAMGAIPANVPGNLGTRFLTGTGIAAAQNEAQRQVANALLPEDRPDLQQQFDPLAAGFGAMTGGVMAGILGHGGVIDHRAAVDDGAGTDRSQGMPGPSAQERLLGSSPAPQSTPTTEPEASRAQSLSRAPAASGDAQDATGISPEDVQKLAGVRMEELASRRKLTPLEQFEFAFLHRNADNPGALAEALGVRLPEDFQSDSGGPSETLTNAGMDGGDEARAASDSQTEPLLTEEPQSAAQEAMGPNADPTSQDRAGTSSDERLTTPTTRRSEPASLDTATTDRGQFAMEGGDAASLPEARTLTDRADENGNLAASSDHETVPDELGDMHEEGRGSTDATQTPAFTKFLDGSQVIDSEGKPRIVYHGTADDFHVFDDGKLGTNTGHMTAPLGHFLTESPAEAQRYAENASQGVPADERVIRAYASIKNPARMTKAQFLDIDSHDEARVLRQRLERQGYDGVRLDLGRGKTQWIAFDSGQIKDVNNRGTFDRSNPDIRYQRTARESAPGLGEKEVSELARGILRMDPDKANVRVVDSYADLPKGVRDHAEAEGVPQEEIRAVHWKGDSYLVADRLKRAQDVEEAIYHEHFAHRGLRVRYGDALGDKLSELLRGVGGTVGVRRMAKEQGIDLSHYETTIVPNRKIPLAQKNAILLEELLAHMSHATGTLKRMLQEWHGAVRDWLRRTGFANLAEYNPSDLAHVLRQARQAVLEKTGAPGTSRPFYQRVFHGTPHRGIEDEGFKLNKIGAGEGAQAYGHGIWDEKHLNKEVTPYFSRTNALARADAPDGIPDELTRDSAAKLNGALATSVSKLLPQKNPIREAVRNDVRSALAQRDRAVGTFDRATRAYLTYYDKQLRTTSKTPLLAMKDAIAFEKGQPIPDSKTRPFYAHMRRMLDAQAEAIRSFGKGYLAHLVTDYFPHQWEDSEAAAKFYGAALQRRPLGGRKEFTRERVVDSLDEGIKAGMRPATLNPAELVLRRYASGEKLLTQLRIMKALEDRGLVRKVAEGDLVPRGYAYVNDSAFGNRVVPEFIARDLSNHLDPGLTKFAPWRGFRWLQNTMLSANLGLSAFHAGMTTLDTIATHADIGWRRIALLGDVKGGLRELAAVPVAVVKSPYEGGKLVKQFYGEKDADPNTGAILDMLTEGGARGTMHPSDINDSFTKLLRAYDQGNAQGVATHALPGLIEGTSRLISHRLVPAQKMVARVLHAKFRLDEVADALGKKQGDYTGIVDTMNPDALREMAHEINSTIDDRLGQFAYDNLFWNKTFRDFLHASVQSVGWNFGTLRLLLGGLKDMKGLAAPEHYAAPLDKAGTLTNYAKSRLSDRLSYLLTLNAVVGLSGVALQYAMTGEGPKEIKDFFFPRTGRKNRDGSDERLSFPSYVKDEYEFTHHPLTTLPHKVHPIFSKAIELGSNRDFYGTQIYDPGASLPQEAKDILTYLGKSFMPYSVTGAMRARDAGKSPVMTALPFVGITSAPGDITKSPFLRYVEDRYFEQQPRTRTQAQAERSRQFGDNVQALQNGTLDTHQLGGKELRRLENAAKTSVTQYRYSRLSLPQQVRGYELASPDERSELGLRSYVGHNLASRLGRLPSDVRADLVQRIREVEGSP